MIDEKRLAEILRYRARILSSYATKRFQNNYELDLAQFQSFLSMELFYLAFLIENSDYDFN